MTFYCDSCIQNKPLHELSILIIRKWEASGKVYRYCKSCRSTKAAVPDVFWDGKPEENLADDPVTGQPRVFSSKAEKSAYLKERGIMEAGDRVHGAPLMVSQQEPPKKDSRPDVMMALKQVKEMGQDVRRQEYLRIVKEGRRYE